MDDTFVVKCEGDKKLLVRWDRRDGEVIFEVTSEGFGVEVTKADVDLVRRHVLEAANVKYPPEPVVGKRCVRVRDRGN